MQADPAQNGPAVRPPPDVNPRSDAPLDFPDADYGELSRADYAELGFMAGLEVHQQLDTASKLFCRCPAGRYQERFDAEVLRHMRPTLSELGEYDGCALMEFKTHKEIVYRLERGSVCTYEIDDTPPFEIDRQAVMTALEIAALFDLNLVSELHVMRKQYLDGSIPTGFQRTAMLGLGGEIPFRVPALGIDRRLRIRQLSLEEDSCREVSDLGHRITFRTDRLGMPLTEVVTEPDFLTPEELHAGARLIAHLTRASGKVRRGPGAARQDVNVSVAGGRRVEIKGVGRHRGLPELVHIEAFRQLNLLRIKAELERRGVEQGSLALPAGGHAWEVSPLVVDAGALLRRCDFEPIHHALDQGELVCALKLPGFGGLLTRRTQPGATFAGELADRVRVIACLPSRPFLIHSDIEGYGIAHGDWQHLRSALQAGEDDALVTLWGPTRDADTAAREIFIRAQDALVGVPAETRQAFADGTTGFERILPGADRMYPDTDTPPLPIPDGWVAEIRAELAERIWDREDRYRALGLDPTAAQQLAPAPWAELFDAIEPAEGAPARLLAATLAKRVPFLRRKSGAALPGPERLVPLQRAVEGDEIRPEGFERGFDRLLAEPESSVEVILEQLRPGPDDERELEERIATAAFFAKRKMADAPPDKVVRWMLGQVLPPMLGKLDPALVRERIERGLGS